MATLLAGAQAVAAAQALAQSGPWLVAHAHPLARDRNQPAQLLALAHSQQCLVIDLARTPKLGAMLAQLPLLGALHGQRLAHALAQTCDFVPTRMACAQICHALLLGDVCPEQSLPDLMASYAVAPGPMPQAGALAAFAREAQLIAQVLDAQVIILKQLQLTHASRIEASALGPIVAMERHGMPVDRALFEACLADERQSMQQLAQILSQQLGTPLSADVDDNSLLQALRQGGHPVRSLSANQCQALPSALGAPLREFAALRRLSQTLGARFASHIAADGRIHSHFLQIGARSGRMACTRPNLQAITADTRRRACFRAPEGFTLVIGDYAACELRILADMSHDEALGRAIAQGTDLHAAIATSMFGREVTKTTQPALRQAAKTIAFGLIYGMGTRALAQALGTDELRAQTLMEQFFAAFPKVRPHLTEHSTQALQQGFVRTLSGRRCTLNAQADGRDRAAMLRMARNLPIQGTSADIIKVALARVHHRVRALPQWAVVHCVHDEIVLMGPASQSQQACRLLEDAMQGAAEGLLQHTSLLADVRARVDWQTH